MAVSCGVGHRCGSDPELLWLWCRLEVTAPIRPLAWEPPYAPGAAIEKTKKKPKKPIELALTSGHSRKGEEFLSLSVLVKDLNTTDPE